MLDRLAEIETKYEDLAEQINDPDVIANQTEWRKRMKEYSDITPIVEKYREYKQAKEGIAESLAMLEEKQEEDFRELLKEELAENKEKAETLKQELTLLLIPKDPNDEKNVCRGFIPHVCALCRAEKMEDRNYEYERERPWWL